MAKRRTTATSLGRPAAFAAACVAGFFSTPSVYSQTPEQPPSIQRLLTEREHNFSEVPLLRDRNPDGSLMSDQGRPQSLPIQGSPMHRGSIDPTALSVQDLLGQSTSQNNGVNVARVVVKEPQADGATQQTPSALPSVSQPTYQTPANTVKPSYEPATPSGATNKHQLRNVSMERFEQTLVDTYGRHLRASTSEDGRLVRVQIPGKGNEKLTTLVDRQSGLLTFEGDATNTVAWRRLMNSIDRLPIKKTDGSTEVTSLIYRGGQEADTLRQVVYLMASPQDPVVDPSLLPGNQDDQEGQIIQGIQGLKKPVRIVQSANGSWTLVGDKDDVAIVQRELQRLAMEKQKNQPIPTGIPLANVRGSQIEERVQEIYDENYASIFGPVAITNVENPNKLIVVGQPKAIEAVRNLVQQLDVASDMDPSEEFKTISLKHISAADAESRLENFFIQSGLTQGENNLPSSPVAVIADYRSNQVTIRGSQTLIRTAEAFLSTIDVDQTAEGAVMEVKIVRLRNTVAADIALVLQDAVTGNQPNANQVLVTGGQGAQGQQQNLNQQAQPNQSTLKSPQLSLMTIGKDGKPQFGAIMFDTRFTPDSGSNSIIVTASQKAMPLVLELIEQLDVMPDAETQIKVFELVHGDAQTVLGMLETLFGAGTQQQGGQQAGGTNLQQLPLQGASSTDGSTLVNIRFSYEPRSNAIIASGPAGDLQVVEDLLARLDARALNHTRPRVYRLSNAPALDVADAINAYLDARNDLINNDPRNPGVTGINRAVIVQHEVISNSLIVSALPEYRKEIEDIIRALDRRPPMVKVKVLIAEVDLNAVEEFGVELGIQDSLLFDRGTSIAAGGALTGIGFPFNSNGNSGVTPNANAFARELLAGQAVSQLGVGATNSNLGYSGFALSAGSESLSVLLRALKDRQCLRVLSKPHITTIENLQGRVSVGASVPRITGTTLNNVGTTQNVQDVDVGVILEVTPRVSPDGMIILSVNAEKSAVGSAESGVVVGFSQTGDPITSPQILKTEATSTLMARSGQTVVFSGLIEESKSHVERGAPILSDLPVIGPLFKFESDTSSRSELMIIMTPYLITSDEDIANMNQDEMERMNWCLADVADVYGNTDFGGLTGTETAVETYYPDQDPTGLVPAVGVGTAPTRSPATMDSRLTDPNGPRLSDVYEDAASGAFRGDSSSSVQKAAEAPKRGGLFSRRR